MQLVRNILKLNRSVVFNLFPTVAHFPTQGNLSTHFGEQSIISVAKM